MNNNEPRARDGWYPKGPSSRFNAFGFWKAGSLRPPVSERKPSYHLDRTRNLMTLRVGFEVLANNKVGGLTLIRVIFGDGVASRSRRNFSWRSSSNQLVMRMPEVRCLLSTL